MHFGGSFVLNCFWRVLLEKMPNPYSLDLRWRIIWLSLARNQSSVDIAKELCVSERTVRRYLDMFWQTGEVEPVKYRHGPPRLLGDFEQVIILRLISEQPGIFLHEIRDKLFDMFGVALSPGTICKTLHYMGCSHQVIQHIALQRSNEQRASFMAEIAMYDPQMLIWIDESGCDRRNSTRKRGYSFRGITPKDHRLLVRGTRYSTVPIMSMEGIHDLYITESTMNGEQFILQCLLPLLQPFNWVNPLSVVVMDNASIHHVAGVEHLITNHGAKLIFLPPYSPDLNPLEEVFSQVKGIMKDNDRLFQATSAPRPLLGMAFAMVTKNDCVAYIRHAGYV